MPANGHAGLKTFTGTEQAKLNFEQMKHKTMILQARCQSDENGNDFNFSQCLVTRHGRTEEEPRVRKMPLATRSGRPRRKAGGAGGTVLVGGFLMEDQAVFDKAPGCVELKTYERENSCGGR
jgi:hypothetical protein